MNCREGAVHAKTTHGFSPGGGSGKEVSNYAAYSLFMPPRSSRLPRARSPRQEKTPAQVPAAFYLNPGMNSLRESPSFFMPSMPVGERDDN